MLFRTFPWAWRYLSITRAREAFLKAKVLIAIIIAYFPKTYCMLVFQRIIEDKGAVFENFFILERVKFQTSGGVGSIMFWRSKKGEEIDLIEEKAGNISAFECKWSGTASSSPPTQFKKSYPNVSFAIVSPDTIVNFSGN